MASPTTPRPLLLGNRQLSSIKDDFYGPQERGGSVKLDCEVVEHVGSMLLESLKGHVNLADIAARTCVAIKRLPKSIVPYLSRECLDDITAKAVEGPTICEGVLASAFSSHEPISPPKADALYRKVKKDDRSGERSQAFWRASRANYDPGVEGEKASLEHLVKDFLDHCELGERQRHTLRQLGDALKNGTFQDDKAAFIELFKSTTDEDNNVMQNAVQRVWSYELIETLLECGIELQPPYKDIEGEPPGTVEENPQSEIMIAKGREDYPLAAKLLLAYNYQQQKGKEPRHQNGDPFPGTVVCGRYKTSVSSIAAARKAFFDNLTQKYLRGDGELYTHGVFVLTDPYGKNTIHIIHWPCEVSDCSCVCFPDSMENTIETCQELGLERQRMLQENLQLTRPPLHSERNPRKPDKPSTYTQRIFWGMMKSALSAGTAWQASYDTSSIALGAFASALNGGVYSDDVRIESSEKLLQLMTGAVACACGWSFVPVMGATGLSIDCIRGGFRNSGIGEKFYNSWAAQIAEDYAETIRVNSAVSTALMVFPSEGLCRYLHALVGGGMLLSVFMERLRTSSTFRRVVFTMAAALVATGVGATAAGYSVGECVLGVGKLVTSTTTGVWALNNLSGALFSKYCMTPIPRKRPHPSRPDDNDARPVNRRQRNIALDELLDSVAGSSGIPPDSVDEQRREMRTP